MLPPLPPDLLAELDALSSTLMLRPDHADIARKMEWLIDALIMRGQLPPSYRKLASKIRGDRSIVRLAIVRDKYALGDLPDIDCAARIPLCGARCCSLEVTLSGQDVIEAKLPFDLMRPYALARDPVTKRCACMDETSGCKAYEHRPATCRTYDCRQDPRVWIDYENRIPAPMPEDLQGKMNEHL